MHNGSWVSFCVGQWVTACDPLFTLVHIMLFELVIAIGRLLGLK